MLFFNIINNYFWLCRGWRSRALHFVQFVNLAIFVAVILVILVQKQESPVLLRDDPERCGRLLHQILGCLDAKKVLLFRHSLDPPVSSKIPDDILRGGVLDVCCLGGLFYSQIFIDQIYELLSLFACHIYVFALALVLRVVAVDVFAVLVALGVLSGSVGSSLHSSSNSFCYVLCLESDPSDKPSLSKNLYVLT